MDGAGIGAGAVYRLAADMQHQAGLKLPGTVSAVDQQSRSKRTACEFWLFPLRYSTRVYTDYQMCIPPEGVLRDERVHRLPKDRFFWLKQLYTVF